MFSRLLKDIRASLGDAFFPPRCPLCDKFVKISDRSCEDCEAGLHHLEADAFLGHLPNVWLKRCRSRFAYDGKVRDAIHGLKYNERLDTVRFFASELLEELLKMGEFDIIVPVPLSPKRIVSRGFNQAALVARCLAKAAGARADMDSLRRVREVSPQVGLERNERIANIRGVFAVDDKNARYVAGRDILIIDDVLTTGATANECARVLINAGAKSAKALTVARTI